MIVTITYIVYLFILSKNAIFNSFYKYLILYMTKFEVSFHLKS